MKRLIDTEKAAEILGITARAIRKKFNKGKIEGQFINSGKGYGRSGQILKVWIDDENNTNKRPSKKKPKDNYRVHRGEPGCHLVTPLINGEPILNNKEIKAPPPVKNIETPPSSINPPPGGGVGASAGMGGASMPVISSNALRIANLRVALIQALQKELATKYPETLPLFPNKNNGQKTRAIKKFLDLYHSGLILSDIKPEIKRIKRSTLYNWLQLYEQGGIDALVPQYRGPQAADITQAEKKFLLTKLLDQNKPTIGDSINKCKWLLGTESPSSAQKLRRWVNQFRCENHDLWVLEREGEKALNDKCIPYAEREWRDIAVGEAVVADGHKLNFQVINPFTGKPSRAVMVLFWDWKSAYPLGWEIMLTENIQCVMAALRNAIITLGKFPKHALLDNGKAFRANIFTKNFRFQETEIPGIFEKLNITPHFSMPYNAQSKPIERFFRTFGDWFERELPSYTGASINDKPAYLLRNEKRARALHDDRVPTIPEAMELIFQWRKYYAGQPSRARDGQTPGEIFESGKGPGVDPFALHFLMMSAKARMVHRNGITFNGWHWYHENLYGFKDYVLMFYSYYDLSQVYLFTMAKNGSPREFLCVAKPIEKVKPFASDSEFPEDMAAVQRINSLKRRVISTTKNLADMLQSQKDIYIDWNKKFRDRPEVADAIRQIEDKNSKVTDISPFVEGVDYKQPEARPKYKPPKQWEGYFEYWERYEHHLKQDPDTIGQEDREFIAWYKNTDEYRRIYCTGPTKLLSGGKP